MTDPVIDTPRVQLWHGDCLDVLRALPDASVHAVVTDPPYGLEFMGREWDGADGFRRSLNPADAGRNNPFGRTSRTSPEYRAGTLFQQWCEAWAAECLRVLTPGGHLLAFGGTRTWHRLACAIEDAGFEVRDSIAWLYGSGFPKSLDVGKAIDKAAGVEREVIGTRKRPGGPAGMTSVAGWNAGPMLTDDGTVNLTAPATPDAARWQGWGTALKPAHEPIVVARKPLTGTVAATVLAHGTGALNVDGCRVGHASAADLAASQAKNPGRDDLVSSDVYGAGRGQQSVNAAGRWPANVALDTTQAAALDEESGVSEGRPARAALDGSGSGSGRPASGVPFVGGVATTGYTDQGGASRFLPTFHWQAKAPTDERPRAAGVAHPTVKPLDLMRWLVRLVTPPGGTVLEPFAGSGTTVEACLLEGFRCIAIEREATYLPLIRERINRQTDPVAYHRDEAADDPDHDPGLFALLDGGAA